MKNKNTPFYIIIVLLVALVLYFIVNPGSTNQNEQIDEQEVTDAMNEPAAKNFAGIWHDDWPLLERAQNGVQTLTSGQLVDGYIMEDPNNKDTVYFATYLYSDNDESDLAYDENMVSIYRYSTKNFHFERLYRATYETSDLDGEIMEGSLPLFRVVGTDGDKLILLVTAMDDSPGPCTSMLLLGETQGRTLWSMDLSDPYGGFESYQLPDDVRTDAEAQMEACQQELYEEV